MEVVDSDETKLLEVRKHIFGIILVYIQTSFGMILATALSYLLLPSVIEDTDQAFYIGSIFAAVTVLISFVVIIFATVIYRQSRLIVTDRNITQVLQYGLFSRKVSQLNIVNIEDVTSFQSGLIPTMLNYGTIKIETAGEQANFSFTFCPNSNHCAKIILDAREKMLGQSSDDLIDTEKKSINTAKSTILDQPDKTKAEPQTSAHTRGTKVQHLGAEVVEQSLSD